MDNLHELREEYRRTGIGQLLLDLLSRIVWSTVQQYPPAEYSGHGTWDQSTCEDVLNDWIAERLWGRSDLQAMLSSTKSTAQFRASLTTSLRQFLTNGRRRSVASNLYKRVCSMLREDPLFQSLSSGSSIAESQWTLAGNHLAQSSLCSVSELVQNAFELSDDELQVVRYGPFSQKLSPILREGGLRQFLVHILERARGALTIAIIIDVMDRRFSLPHDEEIEIDDTIPSHEISPATQAEWSVAAESIVSRLGLDHSRVVRAYFASGASVPIAAGRLGRSRDDVQRIVRDAFHDICESSRTEDDARSIMKQVESLLLQRGE
jgi:hypothetical protein